MLAWLVAPLLNIFPALAESVGKTLVALKETETNRQGSENKSGLDLAIEYLKQVNETNRIKAQSLTERRVLFALLMFAVPAGIHWWAVMLDSMPLFGHVVGSWGIAAPPGEWSVTYHKIIDSFFISAPAIAGASILAKAFRR